MKHIYIHIGFGKTGTTSIQDMLYLYRNNLKKQGVLYPVTGLRGSGHHNLAQLGTTELPMLFDNLKNEIENSHCERIVLSSEFFVFCKNEYVSALAKSLSGYSTTIVFYVRNQVSLLESVFLQWQKVGSEYDEHIDLFFLKHKHSFDFNKKIEPWALHFGASNIIAGVFDKHIIGDDVVIDFLERIGNIRLELTKEKFQSNPSLIPEFSNAITMIDQCVSDPLLRQRFIEELLKLSVKFKKHSDISLLDQSLKQAVITFYKESNIEFADKYLNDTEKDIFLENILNSK